jgi:hypothetical protein
MNEKTLPWVLSGGQLGELSLSSSSLNAAQRAWEQLLEAIRGKAPEFLARREVTRGGQPKCKPRWNRLNGRPNTNTFLDSLGTTPVATTKLRLLRSLNKSGKPSISGKPSDVSVKSKPLEQERLPSPFPLSRFKSIVGALHGRRTQAHSADVRHYLAAPKLSELKDGESAALGTEVTYDAINKAERIMWMKLNCIS